MIKSYAKVNLYLKVFRKDLNNYHKIESHFLIVENLYDKIKIKKNKLNKDIIRSNIKHLNDSNFIFDTLNILREEKIINDFYSIKLNKKIPLGSGLGGGSSNAIAVAKHFTQDKKILNKIAKQVGYDCYFFISGYKSALVTGYGQHVEELEFNKNIRKKDLIFTNIFCDTKLVYQEFDKLEENEGINMLTKAAFKVYPELQKYSRLGIMSGSGSTFIKNKFFK